jgi:primosomal protein N' (replication factor Y)
VVRIGPPDPAVDVARLLPIAVWSGHGPSAEVIELASWTAHRWAAGRLRPLLATASPHRMVRALVGRPIGADPVAGAAQATTEVRLGRLLADGGGVLRVSPSDDLAEVLADAVLLGPVLAVHPSIDGARQIAERLRRSGRSVALLPADWARAAAGSTEFVVGGRSAVWATVPGLAAIVVLDEHDEALQEERMPTWHARDVAVERARRAGIPCGLVSPCPTVSALHWSGKRWMRPTTDDERAGWPAVEVIDRRDVEPWKRSLLSSELIEAIRDRSQRVVCVHNVPGRARMLACRQCRSLLRCERCDASVMQGDDGALACARCATVRPPVCQVCGSAGLAAVRPGVTRLRDELEAAAVRPVVAVTAEAPEPAALARADVFVGTEAVLHRVADADVVVLLDIDAELLAPRYRAAEQALALAVRAARLLGPRRRGGRLLVQTTMPDHEVIQALVTTDPGLVARAEATRRRALALPPFGAMARLSGAGAAEFAARLSLPAAADGDGTLVRAATWDELADAIARTERPVERLRIEVDPARR